MYSTVKGTKRIRPLSPFICLSTPLLHISIECFYVCLITKSYSVFWWSCHWIIGYMNASTKLCRCVSDTMTLSYVINEWQMMLGEPFLVYSHVITLHHYELQWPLLLAQITTGHLGRSDAQEFGCAWKSSGLRNKSVMSTPMQRQYNDKYGDYDNNIDNSITKMIRIMKMMIIIS